MTTNKAHRILGSIKSFNDAISATEIKHHKLQQEYNNDLESNVLQDMILAVRSFGPLSASCLERGASSYLSQQSR
jgi:hypothetical protein